MPVRQGYGAHGEFAFGEHGDDISDTAAVAVSDALLPKVVDVSTLLSRLIRQDTLPVLLNAAAATFITVLRGDSILITATDARSITAALSRGDDILVRIDDVRALAALLTRPDQLAISIGAAVVMPVTVSLLRQDVLSVIVSRLARDAMFGAHGEFGHGEQYRDRHGLPLQWEEVNLLVRVTPADTIKPKTTEQGALRAAITRADQITPKINEGDVRAEERLHRRVINIFQY